MSNIRRKLGFAFLLFLLIFSLYFFSKQPSNDRDWMPDQEVLSYADIRGDKVTVYNVRNIEYRSVDDYDVQYYDKAFDLNDLVSLDYMVEPFSDYEGPAHTLLSFGFENDAGGLEYVAISVEIRKEKGEDFSPWKGMLHEYELMYVIADEQDVIKLRSNYRLDDVYLYPVKADQKKIQELFVSMLQRANSLKEKPEFYNTITSTCTTNIVDHVNDLSEGRVPFSYKVLLPAYSGELAYDLDLIDTDLNFEEAQEKFKIDDLAQSYDSNSGVTFSDWIRSGRAL